MTSRLRTHGLIAATVAVTFTLGAGLTATAMGSQQDQESRRLRQLEVFERLLTETVQEQVSSIVNTTIDAARRGDPDGDGIVSDVAAEPLVVKVGAPLAAHGIYIADYGVMFSIETPQVSVIPQSFERVLAQPRALFRLREGGLFESAGPMGVVEIRADQVDRSLDDLIVLLERSGDESYTVSVEQLREVKGALEELRGAETPHADTVELTAEATTVLRERGEEAAGREADGNVRAGAVGSRNSWARYYRDAVEQRSSMQGVLERNHQQVALAMREAAIDTLASYGSLIKGLDDDERITVIVLPPKTWDFARGFGVGVEQDEHIISARYKDIRELDASDIDYDEFVKRAQVRNRLGLEIVHEDDSEGR
ncbi:MAG: hypothetical protein GKS06_14430 [Acidobacteria bacterium]|nr:hypothetical protein [Acidobacteriota bacterium]